VLKDASHVPCSGLIHQTSFPDQHPQGKPGQHQDGVSQAGSDFSKPPEKLDMQNANNG
jgi:hypothetical protein